MTRLTGVMLPADDNAAPIALAYNDMTLRLAFNASGNLQYVGKAIGGSLSASAVWQVRKLSYDTAANDNLSSVLYASGTLNYDQIWDNRVSLVYL